MHDSSFLFSPIYISDVTTVTTVTTVIVNDNTSGFGSHILNDVTVVIDVIRVKNPK